jgi:hypothetical protein
VLVYDRPLTDAERTQLESYLRDKYFTSNQPPAVALTSPQDGATYTEPADIPLEATASDGDGTIARVDFRANGAVIGSDATAPYQFLWKSVSEGNIRAHGHRVRTTTGASTTSAPVDVTVMPQDHVPQTGLQLWLESDAGVVLNGSHVSQWSDQSGHGRDAVQTNPRRSPAISRTVPTVIPWCCSTARTTI